MTNRKPQNINFGYITPSKHATPKVADERAEEARVHVPTIDSALQEAVYAVISNKARLYRTANENEREKIKAEVYGILRDNVHHENVIDRCVTVFEAMCLSNELAQECGRCRSKNNGCASTPKYDPCSIDVVKDITLLALNDEDRQAVFRHYFEESSAAAQEAKSA